MIREVTQWQEVSVCRKNWKIVRMLAVRKCVPSYNYSKDGDDEGKEKVRRIVWEICRRQPSRHHCQNHPIWAMKNWPESPEKVVIDCRNDRLS